MNGGLSMAEMKSGYKMTDVGVIPEDWEVKEFNETFSVIPNNSLSRDYLNTQAGEYHDIHYGDVLIKYGALLDAGNTEIPFINKAITDKWVNRRIVTEGDIIMADTAEDNTVGKCSEVINVNHKKIVSGLHTFWLHPNEGLFEKGFLGYFMNHSLYHNQLLPLIHGTKVSSVSKNEILGTRVLVPLKNEQTAIATALSDVDSLISALTKKIEKKKAIKQGLMQQLLTGKKRLPGFGGVWDVVQLKRIISEFIVPMRDKPTTLTGPIPWCRIEDFDGKYLKKSLSNQGVELNTVSKMNLKIFPVNTLLVSCSANLGRCAIVKQKLVTNQTFIGLVPSDRIDVEFLYYKMSREDKNLNNMATGTTISYLSREQFENYEILIPSSKAEQTAIANILSDCDSEIAALEEKRDKYKEIKQGMMQQLLTGKIRLIK